VAAPTGIAKPIRIDKIDAGESAEISALAERFDNPLALDPDGHLLAVGTSYGQMIDLQVAPRIGLVDLESGSLLLDESVDGLPVTAGFSPDGGTVAFAITKLAGPHSLPVFDTGSGDEVARLEISGSATSLGFSPDGRRLAIGGMGTLELHDLDAALDGRDSLIGRAVTGHGEDPVVSPTFDDESTTVVAGQLPTVSDSDRRSWVTAWSADAELSPLWSIGGELPVGTVDISDGLVWMPAKRALPIAVNEGTMGVIGVPIDRRELADFARSKATRSLTEEECRTHFRSSCDRFAARVG
jgi:WD40 repeat protein